MNKKIKPHIMWLWVAVIAVSVILDQVTKLIVVKNMELYETAPFIKGIIEFRYIENRGALDIYYHFRRGAHSSADASL